MMVQIKIGVTQYAVIALDGAVIRVFVPADIANDAGRKTQAFKVLRQVGEDRRAPAKQFFTMLMEPFAVLGKT